MQYQRAGVVRRAGEGSLRLNERGDAIALGRPWFVWAVVLGLLLVAIGTEAQQPARTYRIGYLSSAPASPPNGLEPFRQGLRELGYVEGRNVFILERFAENRLDRLPELAADLVRLKVDIIVTFSTPAAKAASQATTTIPIVMSSGGDPVGLGLVASVRHPGGNVTGFTHLAGPEMWAKVLEFLKEIAPNVSRVGVLRNSAIPPDEAGGLLAYGTSFDILSHQTATYVDKILKGAQPGDLPVQQPTKFELVVNLRTAKALGLTIPPSLLLRADQVIE